MARAKVIITLALKLLILYVVVVSAYMQNCNSHKVLELNYCVEPSGFYFNLAKGSTWNVSFTEGEGLQEREEFLKSLENSRCPLTLPMKNCGNDCCFCGLGIPLPRHPISKKHIIPSGLVCKANLIHRDNHPCQFIICDSNDPITMPFLSIHYHNLKRLNRIYRNPSQLSKDSFFEQLRRNVFKYCWRNYTDGMALTIYDDIAMGKYIPAMMTEELGDGDGTTPSPDILEDMDGHKFSLVSEDEVDIVTIESRKNLTFSFSNK